jgi:hypothetical protein
MQFVSAIHGSAAVTSMGDRGFEPLTPSLSSAGLVDRIHATYGKLRGSDFA